VSDCRTHLLVGEWLPEDAETLVVRTLFDMNARIIEVQDDVRAIRSLPEGDVEEEEEGAGGPQPQA